MFEDVRHPKFLTEEWKPHADRWYCLHCICDGPPHLEPGGWANDSGVRVHNKQKHTDGEDAELGVDYCNGLTLANFLRRWRLENESVIFGFERVMQSIFTVDDLLFEAGGA